MMFYGQVSFFSSRHHKFVCCDLKRTHLVKTDGLDLQSLQIRTSLFDFMGLN